MKPMTSVAIVVSALLALSPAASAQTAGGGSGARRGAPAQSGKTPTASPWPQGERPTPQGFSVVLVLGDLQGGAASDNVPAAARKALADMKDFLPYKGYRLLDAQWTLCCSRGPNTSVVSRLRGADGQEYELSLSTSPDSRGRLGVRFLLREPSSSGTVGTAPASEVVVRLQGEVVRLQQQLELVTAKAHSRAEAGVGGPVDEDKQIQAQRARLADLKIRLAEARGHQATSRGRSIVRSANHSVIDTSFTMDVGETVVVGTSRVAGGEKALIALLTAVPQKPDS